METQIEIKRKQEFKSQIQSKTQQGPHFIHLKTKPIKMPDQNRAFFVSLVVLPYLNTYLCVD
jgi:hypothetical protein